MYELTNEKIENQQFISKVFMWMFFGLFVTGVVATLSTNIPFLVKISSSLSGVVVISIIEIVFMIIIHKKVWEMNASEAATYFIIFTMINGLTFSSIFVHYEMQSTIVMFFICSATFGIMGTIGYFTKKDLTKWGNCLLNILLGVLITLIVNLVLRNSIVDMMNSCVCVLLFMGYIAYDIQNLKKIKYSNKNNDCMAISGALMLYIDFINLFVHLLKLFAKEK